ncbi:lactate dehydrogenase [Nitrosopumilus sp. Nsub]|uniref:lactate/malate family dehydrogenase n=1 Tax=Nitrosopumilus sp. Nsub TaxID=1776294 RepID=UPI0008297C90|nr:lactate dehydrogenase [Nitrosopumilus sp. Nsub]
MITIIGSGLVGTSIAFLCATNELDDILLIDHTKNKAIGESLDITNSISSTSKYSINGTDDYSKLTGSRIVVITASTKTNLKNRTENMAQHVNMIQDIAKKIKQYSPNAIVLIVSNPLDVLTYFFQKESQISRFKVIGIASSLDSSRFQYHIANNFSIPQTSITDALVVGEHGDTMVPIFSNVHVDGNFFPISDNDQGIITCNVRNYWKTLRDNHCQSKFGIAKNVYDVIDTILNKKEISIPASIVLEGEYGENNVAIGVPIKINHTGVKEIKNIDFNQSEKILFKKSSETIKNNIHSV